MPRQGRIDGQGVIEDEDGLMIGGGERGRFQPGYLTAANPLVGRVGANTWYNNNSARTKRLAKLLGRIRARTATALDHFLDKALGERRLGSCWLSADHLSLRK